MAVEEQVVLEGGQEVQSELQAMVRSMLAMAAAQESATRSGKRKTAEEKQAIRAVREHRRALREQRRALRAMERQRKQNIRTLKSFVGGMTGAQFGAAALGAAIAGLGAATVGATIEFGEFVNELAKTGRAFGLTADEVAVLGFQLERLTKGGVDTSKALTAIVDAAGRAQQGLGEFTRIFDQLGVEVEDANGNLKSTSVLFDEVRGALAGARTEQEAMATATQLFGRRMAADLLPALRATDDEVASLEERYFALAGTIGSASEQAELQADAITDMSTAFSALKREIGEAFSPLVVAGANALASALGAIRRALEAGSGRGSTAADLVAEFQTVTALEEELIATEERIRGMKGLRTVGFDAAAAEEDREFTERMKARAEALQEAIGLLQIETPAVNDLAAANDGLARSLERANRKGEKQNELSQKRLTLLPKLIENEKALRLERMEGLAEKALEQERLRQQAIDESAAAYQRLVEAQRAANESTLSGIEGLLSGIETITTAVGGTQDNAIAKALQIGQVFIRTIQAVSAAQQAAAAVQAAQSAASTAQQATQMGVIAAAAAPAATLSSIAQGPGSIGTILAVAGSLAGAVGSIISIAKASKGATPQWLQSLPAIDNQGHRLMGVLPTETVLDPNASAALPKMMDAITAKFMQPQAAQAAGPVNVSVAIGGEQFDSFLVNRSSRGQRTSMWNRAA